MADNKQLEPIKARAELITDARAAVNPALVYCSQLAPEGRRTMLGRLRKVANMLGGTIETFPWHSLRFEHVAAIRTKLAETYAPATVNMTMAAIRGTVKAAWRLGLMSQEDMQRIADVRLVKESRLPSGRALHKSEVTALFVACQDGKEAGARDAAILAVAYACGLRRAEIAALQRQDVAIEGETDEGVAYSLLVNGKGSKQRMVYMDNGAARAMSAWLAIRGEGAGALFWRSTRAQTVLPGKGLTAQTIRNILQKRAAMADIEDVTPHDLRRSFITHQLDAGTDALVVAAMAGHAKLDTTRRYDRRGEEAKRQAAKALRIDIL